VDDSPMVHRMRVVGTRRMLLGLPVLGALLSGAAVLLGSATAVEDKRSGKGKSGEKGKHKKTAKTHDRGQGTNRATTQAKGKKKHQKKDDHNQIRANASTCYPGTRCTLGPSQYDSNCDFSQQTLSKRNLSSSFFRGSSFAGSNLTQAKLSGANLSKTCLVDADLTGADLTGANTLGAIFCRTTMPDGSVNNSGCDKGTACCPTAAPPTPTPTVEPPTPTPTDTPTPTVEPPTPTPTDTPTPTVEPPTPTPTDTPTPTARNLQRSAKALAQPGVREPTPTPEQPRPSVLRMPPSQTTRTELVAGPSSDASERVTFGLGALLAAGVGIAEYVSRRHRM
jgi:Pentapeptide repeats (8 copies)